MSEKGFKRVAKTAEAPAGSREKEEGLSAASADPRRDPAAVLAAAATVAPTLPPTRVEPSLSADPIGQLNLKVRVSLIDQLADAAVREGTTQKILVCRALADAGYRVHPDDLSDRGNHRRRRPHAQL
jgi:hypothetical protein